MIRFTVLSRVSSALVVLLMSALASAAPSVVNYPAASQYEPGTIVIHAPTRKLYYIYDSQTAIQYPVAVPAAGRGWSGETSVTQLDQWPAWAPPAEVKRAHPELPDYIPGGDPRNPMGAAAISLAKSEIAIHGTTQSMRRSIGTAASFGCIRMLNEDVQDLYSRVQIGTRVIMQAR